VRAWLGVLAVGAGLAATPLARAQAQLTLAEVQVAEGVTQIVLESRRPIRFSAASLDNPPRLVVDLQGFVLNPVASALAAKTPPRHPYLAAIRVSKEGRNTVRLQLFLIGRVEPRVSAAPRAEKRGHRLVIALQREAQVPARAATPPMSPSPSAEEIFQETFLEISVNGQKPRAALVLRRKGGGLLVRAADLEVWRLTPPKGTPLMHRGEAFHPLEAYPGLTYRIDEPKQAVIVEAPAALMRSTVLSATQRRFAMPPPAPPGVFANYDVLLARTENTTSPGGIFEVGAFGAGGVGVNSFLARRVGDHSQHVRLETTYTRDRPDKLDSLRAGDTIGRPGAWGRAVRFGGVQLSTNFATQPGFITFPMPGLAGEAALPSTVDIYVNDALRLRRDVPTGPFTIQDLPTVTGRGDARLVVRDLLGREQVIVVPYYSTPRLLRKGLHDYSYEIGAVRENFGLASSDYGRGFGAGTHRVGFSDTFTGEARGELLGDQQTVGVGGAVLVGDLVVVDSALAASRDTQRGSGGFGRLGVERQTRAYGFGASLQSASERFVQLGLQPDELAPARIVQAFAGVSPGGTSSLGIGFARQDFRDRPDTKLATLTYGVGVGRFGFASASLQRVYAPSGETSLNLLFAIPYGEMSSATVSSTKRNGAEAQTLAQAQRSLPLGPGYGYRVLASLTGDERYEAGLSLQNNVGTYVLEAGEVNGLTALRASAAGGLSFFGGGLHASRRLSDGFGVVQLPGYPGVRVYADNQEVGVTGADGNTVLPRLRPYQRNDIRIEEADIPFDARIESVQRNAVPYYRSGVILPFAVKPARGALLTVHLEDGEPVPAGATARIDGAAEEFAVGFRGELYLAGLGATNRVRVTWNGHACEFALPFEPKADPLPDLGAFTCRQASR
jgi:outer membrane usher protein